MAPNKANKVLLLNYKIFVYCLRNVFLKNGFHHDVSPLHKKYIELDYNYKHMTVEICLKLCN